MFLEDGEQDYDFVINMIKGSTSNFGEIVTAKGGNDQVICLYPYYKRLPDHLTTHKSNTRLEIGRQAESDLIPGNMQHSNLKIGSNSESDSHR